MGKKIIGHKAEITIGDNPPRNEEEIVGSKTSLNIKNIKTEEWKKYYSILNRRKIK